MESQPMARALPRPVMLTITGTLILALVLVVGVHHVLMLARGYDAREDALRYATDWSQHMVSHTPDIADAFANGPTTADQLSAIEMADSMEGVIRFSMFSPDGDLAYTTAPDVVFPDDPAARAEVLAVVAARAPVVSIHANGEAPDVESAFACSYLPISDEDGQIIGVIRLITYRATPTVSFNSAMDFISVAIPLVCALAFLVPMLIVMRMLDRTRRKDQDLLRLSYSDPLTGTLNRAGLLSKAKRIFDERRDPSQQVGVFHLDIDDFKSINEGFGTHVGDEYLQHLADHLCKLVGDSGFVGRIGGDEFLILTPGTTGEGLRRLGIEILATAKRSLTFEDCTLTVSFSIGMHLSPMGEALDRALRSADLALLHAKQSGRNQVQQYFDALDQANNRGRNIEACLRRAIDENSLEIHYQPFVDSKTGQVAGFEALLRLRGDDNGLISPEDFIPVAERTGLIHDVGLQTLEKAMRTATGWPDHIYVSVNLSPVQFQKPDLPDRIFALINKVGLAPERLDLEMTESLLLTDEAGVSEKLARFQAHGIRIAMDDFGTGYSSLGYLWKYNFNKIKIDRSFLQGHDFDQKRYRDIIETIVLLGHKLGMEVTVEGVETQTQTDFLIEMGCDQFQGFFFSRPMPADQTAAVIAQLQPASADEIRCAG